MKLSSFSKLESSFCVQVFYFLSFFLIPANHDSRGRTDSIRSILKEISEPEEEQIMTGKKTFSAEI